MHKVAQGLPRPWLPAAIGEALGALSPEEGNYLPPKQQAQNSAKGGGTFSWGGLGSPRAHLLPKIRR